MTLGSIGSSMLDCFQAFLKRAVNFAPFSGKWEPAIKVLLHLWRNKTSLEAYEILMRWHLEAAGCLHPRESLSKSPYFTYWEKLHKELKIRCNRDADHDMSLKLTFRQPKPIPKSHGMSRNWSFGHSWLSPEPSPNTVCGLMMTRLPHHLLTLTMSASSTLEHSRK